MTDQTTDGAHVRPTMREFLAIDGRARMRKCWDRVWISTPSTREAFVALDECMQASPSTKPRGLTITGGSDTGKSRLLKAFRDANPSTRAPGSDYATFPAVYLNTVNKPDTVSLYKDILAQLGHPLLYNASEPDLKRHVVRMMKECRVGVVMIDEFNDIANDRMDKRLDRFLRELKGLINVTERPFVVTGTPTVLDITASEGQIGGRLKRTLRLRPFTLSELAPVALAFEKMLPLRKPSNFRGDERIVQALFDGSQGFIGRLSHMLEDACLIAIDTGEERITPGILAKVQAATSAALGSRD